MSENTINSLNLDSLDLYDEHDFKNQSNHMNQSSDNIPKLRFPEFTGDWEKKKLGEVAVINPSNKNLPDEFIYIDLESVENGELLKENLIQKCEAPSRAQRILTQGDILFQMVRPYQMNNLYFDRIGNYVASTGYAQIRTNNNKAFLFQHLHFQKFVDKVIEKCTGTSYPAINSTDLSNIEVCLPKLEEQTRIAIFLTAVDSKLQALKKKKSLLEEYKKGVMQKLFSQELRFKPALSEVEGDENGKDFPKWEVKTLGAYLQSSKLKNINLKFNKSDVLSVSGEFGIVNQIEFQGRSFAGESVHNYGVVETGDIVYTKSPLKSNPYGIIKVNKGKAGIVSTLYAVYKCKNTLNGVFLDYYFQLDENTNGYLRPLVQKGSKNDMKINNERVLIDPVFFPSIEEQTRIANFLSSIDEKINHCQKQIEQTEVWKKGLLQKMFV